MTISAEAVEILTDSQVYNAFLSAPRGSWHERELGRLTTSSGWTATDALGRCLAGAESIAYRKVPWPLARHELDLIPHMSVRGDGLVAYTESPEKGERDIQQRIKVGRYLARYRPDIPQATRERYSAQFLEDDPIDGAAIQWADSEDEMVQVYKDGPQSCMKGMDCVRVYAYGDLRLAYLSKVCADGNTRIVARGLVYPAQKTYGRIYPTDGNCPDEGRFSDGNELAAWRNKLKELLEAEGYRSGSLEGARLTKIKIGNDYVMPYIDNCGISESEDGNCFILAESCDYEASETDGTLQGREEFTCDRCDDEADEDNLYTVWTRASMSQSASWCDYCRDNHSFYCEGENENFSNEVDSVTIDGETYTMRYAESRDNFYFCEGEQEYHMDGDSISVNGTTYNRDWAEENLTIYFDDHTGEYVEYDDNEYDDDGSEVLPFVELANGEKVGRDNLDGNYFQSDRDGKWYPVDKAVKCGLETIATVNAYQWTDDTQGFLPFACAAE